MSDSFNTVLILFPWPSLGTALVREFLGYDRRIYLLLDDPEAEYTYRNFLSSHQKQLNLISLKDSAAAFWEQSDPLTVDRIAGTQVVINCIGHDFIRLQVEGEGEDWRIRASDAEQKRFAFLDLLLKHFRVTQKQIWINLVYGKAGHANEQTFCDTRYGIMGFSSIMKMIPGLAVLHISDVCLTFLRHRGQPGRVGHCQRCSAEKFLNEAPKLDKPGEIAKFLVRISNRHIHET
jgi:hypothetical protein